MVGGQGTNLQIFLEEILGYLANGKRPSSPVGGTYFLEKYYEYLANNISCRNIMNILQIVLLEMPQQRHKVATSGTVHRWWEIFHKEIL